MRSLQLVGYVEKPRLDACGGLKPSSARGPSVMYTYTFVVYLITTWSGRRYVGATVVYSCERTSEEAKKRRFEEHAREKPGRGAHWLKGCKLKSIEELYFYVPTVV